MSFQGTKHEIDAIRAYQNKGYNANYHFKDKRLIDSDTKYGYKPEEVFLVKQERYEGMSNPEDMSILYVIQTADGVKGTFLLGFGPTGDLEAAEFFSLIPKENCVSE